MLNISVRLSRKSKRLLKLNTRFMVKIIGIYRSNSRWLGELRRLEPASQMLQKITQREIKSLKRDSG